MIHTRRAGPMDTRAMAALLNEIIEIGGTTAYTDPVTPEYLADRITSDPERSVWHIAEDDAGTLMGFQWIEPMDDPTACAIATFARVGKTGLGIGSRLFEETCKSARSLGYTWIQAAIRADNTGGIAYYQSRGFELYGHRRNITLANGQVVDQELRRYDL